MAKKERIPSETERVIALVRERMKKNSATQMLGFEIEHIADGSARFAMEVKGKHRQFQGVVHGGILAALADTTAAIAAYSAVPRGTEIATVELKINYLEPVAGGRIRAEAKVLKAGRNFVVTECEIFNPNGKLAAKALLTFGAAAGHSIQK